MKLFGFKGKIEGLMAQLQERRKAGVDASLNAVLAEEFPGEGEGRGATSQDVFRELGVDARTTTVDELMSGADTRHLMPEIVRNSVRKGMGLVGREQLKRIMSSLSVTASDGGAQRFMSPEIFLDPVMRGAVQAGFYQDLIVGEEPVTQPTVTVPKIEISDALLKETGEAATIEEGSVSYGSKVVTLAKLARGFKITYEAIRYNRLNLASFWFMDAGRILAHTLNGLAVTTLINGDQADGSEAADVVGVNDTNDKIAWYDMVRVANRLGLLGRNGTQLIVGEAVALDIRNLDEVKNLFYGVPLLGIQQMTGSTMPNQLFLSGTVPANKAIINDPSSSLVQLTSAPLMVESEKIISKQIEASFISITTGFAKLQRNASVVLDGGNAWVADTATDFASFMAPYS